jgi:S-(hydroxymethyl)glutathione dehydrogenase/alcohol dehydrogenase
MPTDTAVEPTRGSIHLRAVIFHDVGQPVTVENVDIDEPSTDEVLVKTAASGICGSDLHYFDGTSAMPYPAVFGHEGAGIVEAVGPGVNYVKPGDHVIACLSVYCGQCDDCLTGHTNLCEMKPERTADQPPRLSQNGTPLHQHARVGSHAEYMLLHQNGLVKIRDDMPLDRASLIGCGVTTGFGATLRTAKVEPGSTVAVFGTGGVGLSAINGAVVAGARTVIAVDIRDDKLEIAATIGATDLINGAETDPVEAIREITHGGADFTFEAIGNPAVGRQAFDALRAGGTCTVIGVMPIGSEISIVGRDLLREKKLQGSSMGSNRLRVDIPRYVDMYLSGKLKLDAMITNRGTINDAQSMFDAAIAGDEARQIFLFDS